MKKKSQKALAALPPKDLIVLAADTETSFALDGIFTRSQSLGIHQLQYEIRVHPEHDPGCAGRSVDLLRLYLQSYEYALVIFDREGCGQEDKQREELEQQVEDELAKSGWEERVAAVAIDPELENWVWSDSPHVSVELGWKNQPVDLRSWLLENGYLEKEDQAKPLHPKEAMQAVLRKVKKPRSSAIFYALATKVGLNRCNDPSFLKLKATLHSWFAVSK